MAYDENRFIMAENKELSDRLRIRPEVAAKLVYYVYAYVDPRDSGIFYVGKGCGARALAHLDEAGESVKVRRIAELKAAGFHPRIDILAHGLADEETALRIEAAVIDALWPGKTLTNKVRGNYSLEFGRVHLSELEMQYGAKPMTIAEPAMLIRFNKLYRPGMTAEALYEATRGVWICGTRRESARYGFAVYQSVVREVFEIHAWYPAGTLEYRTRAREEVKCPGRWEFSGAVASELSARYKGGSVEKYFTKGARIPFTYVNC
jgi:hypothetical protein